MIYAETMRWTRAAIHRRSRRSPVLLVGLVVLVGLLNPKLTRAQTVVPSDTFEFAEINWVLMGGAKRSLPEPTAIGFDITNDLFTSFAVVSKFETFDLLEGGVYQSVNVLPHGPAEFYNALFLGGTGTWEIQRGSKSLYYLVLTPSYGDPIDTGYVSEPLVRPETKTIAFGTFTVTPISVSEPSTLALLDIGGAGCVIRPNWRSDYSNAPVPSRSRSSAAGDPAP